MSKILVGYINGNYANGINAHLINFLNSQSNNQVDFVTQDDPERVIKRIKNNKSNVYQVCRSRFFLKQLLQFRKIIKKNKYDIAYFNLSESYSCVGLIAAKLFGIKKIAVHSHNSDACGGNVFFKRILNFIFKPILSWTVNSYYTCSNKAAKWLFPKKIYATKSYDIIYNKIDFNKFIFNQDNRDYIRKKFNLEDKFVLGYVGRFRKEKNYLFLIDMLSCLKVKNKNAVLFCICSGKNQKFINYAKKNGVYENIILLEPVENIFDYYSAFDAFVLPSRNEGLPIVGIEAQVNGCPSYFSDRITDEIIIGRNSKMLGIGDASVWAEEIYKNKKRENPLTSKSNDYDLNDLSQYEKIADINYKTNNNLPFNSILIQILMIHYLLNLTNYFNGINFLMIPCFFLMIIISINYLKNYRDIFRDKIFILFCLFIIDYSLTFLVVKNYNSIGFVKGLIWLLILSIFVYGNKHIKDDKIFKYEMKQEIKLFVCIVTIINIVNFYLLITGFKGFIYSFTNKHILFGMSEWGRFYGMYYDPNYASVICGIAIFAAIYLFILEKNIVKKIPIIFTTFFQLLYLIVSQSRSGLLSFMVGVLVFIIFCLIKYIKRFNFKKVFMYSAVVIVIGFASLLTINIANKNYNTNVIDTKNDSKYNLPNLTQDDKKVVNIMKRRDIDKKDISNRRIDIWKSFFDIYKNNNYIFGVGHSNIVEYAKDNIPSTYIVNNNFSEFNTAHNIFIDVLTSQGIIGLLIFITMIIYEIYIILKNKIVSPKNKNYGFNVIIFTMLIIILTSSAFLTEIFYVNNACTFMFWLLLSYLNYDIIRSRYE